MRSGLGVSQQQVPKCHRNRLRLVDLQHWALGAVGARRVVATSAELLPGNRLRLVVPQRWAVVAVGARRVVATSAELLPGNRLRLVDPQRWALGVVGPRRVAATSAQLPPEPPARRLEHGSTASDITYFSVTIDHCDSSTVSV